MQSENTEKNLAEAPVNSAPDQPQSNERRDLNDPKATFEDLPYKPQLTEKQAKRANQTLKGMLISIGFCIAVFLPLYFLNPQPSEESFKSDVDLAATAQEAAPLADFEVFAPQLADDESANFARWQQNTAQAVPYWEFGVISDQSHFVWVRQAGEANDTWIALTSDSALPTGTRDIGGIQWEERTKDDTTFLIARLQDSTFILSSDTGDEELVDMAERVAHAER